MEDLERPFSLSTAAVTQADHARFLAGVMADARPLPGEIQSWSYDSATRVTTLTFARPRPVAPIPKATP